MTRWWLTLCLVFAACGSSSAPGTERNAKGVREAYAEYVQLIKNGHGDEACDSYLTKAARTLAGSLGQPCGKFLEDAAESTDDDARIYAVNVSGNRATYVAVDDEHGRAVYDGDHWRLDLGS
jgi:hypothetical protein